MTKHIINPWTWQDERSYVQAVEVRNPTATLYISGQTAIDQHGQSSTADMPTQFTLALANLKAVIEAAGYTCNQIVRLNIYTTSTTELMDAFGIFQEWISGNGVQQATTVLEVPALFETLKVEVEATLVR
ncbi:enamine deaminase RidA (YjgF/YER057c/UK114 family) [Neolewinella xylanilytica]|uniref:Enamine deaminase RidA (YjgF/YER057c/UK114 family) n=1 Tax=Neolewinella xylanilytica TaxID=1514080 RepID=A0A2S6I4V0_9BACT|nr:RidA family protein [Neolewinella xylanilytica]PPK86184.1 enamine deaminase RidA (YjgF/YER057c/UK114 family) [Neolewinella xylanilytica]